MDIKFITNGQDARAAIFYITDYITKSELSSYESLSLIKLALDKVDKDEFSRKKNPNLTESENLARRRIWTCLNVIDAHVERSAQWCAHGLMGRVYEYMTHSFCSFNVHSFIGYLQALANSGDCDDDPKEYTVPSFTKEKNAPVKIATTSKRMDYTLRTEFPTDRYKLDEKPQTYLFQNCATAAETLADMSPYEFHFRAEKRKKPKCKDREGVSRAYALKHNEVPLASAHPQCDTHYIAVKDVSNPKSPHLIPNMFGYILPNVASDPEKYYLIMMALFAPYHSADNILSHPTGPDYKSYEASFHGFMEHLVANNPIKHEWLKGLMANMNTIREGKHQQQKERAQREELKQAQGLVAPDVEGPYGNDGEEGLDGATYATQDELADVMRTIEHRYKNLVPAKVAPLVTLLKDKRNIHPSKREVNARLQLPA
jgi:hypothetical protein